MARELPIISPGNIITYDLGNCHYTSVVLEVSGIDAGSYLQVTVYDLLTPNATNFPPATVDNPVEISINPLISNLVVYDYDNYYQQYPELFI